MLLDVPKTSQGSAGLGMWADRCWHRHEYLATVVAYESCVQLVISIRAGTTACTELRPVRLVIIAFSSCCPCMACDRECVCVSVTVSCCHRKAQWLFSQGAETITIGNLMPRSTNSFLPFYMYERLIFFNCSIKLVACRPGEIFVYDGRTEY